MATEPTLPPADTATVLVDRQDLVGLIEALHGAISAAEYLEPEKFDDPEHEQEWQDSLQGWKDTRDEVNKKYGI